MAVDGALGHTGTSGARVGVAGVAGHRGGSPAANRGAVRAAWRSELMVGSAFSL